jgi:hypothetical protein
MKSVHALVLAVFLAGCASGGNFDVADASNDAADAARDESPSDMALLNASDISPPPTAPDASDTGAESRVSLANDIPADLRARVALVATSVDQQPADPTIALARPDRGLVLALGADGSPLLAATPGDSGALGLESTAFAAVLLALDLRAVDAADEARLRTAITSAATLADLRAQILAAASAAPLLDSAVLGAANRVAAEVAATLAPAMPPPAIAANATFLIQSAGYGENLWSELSLAQDKLTLTNQTWLGWHFTSTTASAHGATMVAMGDLAPLASDWRSIWPAPAATPPMAVLDVPETGYRVAVSQTPASRTAVALELVRDGLGVIWRAAGRALEPAAPDCRAQLSAATDGAALAAAAADPTPQPALQWIASSLAALASDPAKLTATAGCWTTNHTPVAPGFAKAIASIIGRQIVVARDADVVAGPLATLAHQMGRYWNATFARDFGAPVHCAPQAGLCGGTYPGCISCGTPTACDHGRTMHCEDCSAVTGTPGLTVVAVGTSCQQWFDDQCAAKTPGAHWAKPCGCVAAGQQCP